MHDTCTSLATQVREIGYPFFHLLRRSLPKQAPDSPPRCLNNISDLKSPNLGGSKDERFHISQMILNPRSAGYGNPLTGTQILTLQTVIQRWIIWIFGTAAPTPAEIIRQRRQWKLPVFYVFQHLHNLCSKTLPSNTGNFG